MLYYSRCIGALASAATKDRLGSDFGSVPEQRGCHRITWVGRAAILVGTSTRYGSQQIWSHQHGQEVYHTAPLRRQSTAHRKPLLIESSPCCRTGKLHSCQYSHILSAQDRQQPSCGYCFGMPRIRIPRPAVRKMARASAVHRHCMSDRLLEIGKYTSDYYDKLASAISNVWITARQYLGSRITFAWNQRLNTGHYVLPTPKDRGDMLQQRMHGTMHSS